MCSILGLISLHDLQYRFFKFTATDQAYDNKLHLNRLYGEIKPCCVLAAFMPYHVFMFLWPNCSFASWIWFES